MNTGVAIRDALKLKGEKRFLLSKGFASPLVIDKEPNHEKIKECS